MHKLKQGPKCSMSYTRKTQADPLISLKAESRKTDMNKDLTSLKLKMRQMKKNMVMILQKIKWPHLVIQHCWAFQKRNLMNSVMNSSRKRQLFSLHESIIEWMR